MIEIKPDVDFTKMSEYLNIKDEKAVFMSVYDNEELLGAIALDAKGEITAIKAEYDFLYDGMIKSAINFFDRRRIKDVKCGICKMAKYLSAIGFKEDNGVYKINTDDFFNKTC